MSDAELARLYRRSAVVVVPSEVEGFGLPVLEAYASGTPVAYAAGTSLEEVARAGTDVGAFAFAPDALADAVDAALALSAAEVERVQGALLAAFSAERLRDRVLASLRATAEAG